MSRRRRRATHLTAVIADDVDGDVEHARLVIDVGELDWPERDRVTIRPLRRWFPALPTWPVPLGPAGSGTAIVCDDFRLTLHATTDGGGFEFTADHDGERFVRAGVRGGVHVVIVEGVAPRRATDDELAVAAGAGRLAGAVVDAYRVDVL